MKTILAEDAPPAPTLAQKFAALPSGTKLAVYCGSGGAAALLISAALFSCIRARRAGKRERDAYNAKVEQEREEAYRDQMELREKGIGGWDENAFKNQGDDALGGWGGTHVPAGTKATDFDFPDPVDKNGPVVMANEIPQGNDVPRGFEFETSAQPTIPRVMSPVSRIQTPNIVQPIPQSPRAWTGGNAGGMIHNAGNAYNGGYGGPSRSPSFPLQSTQQNYGGGYQRF